MGALNAMPRSVVTLEVTRQSRILASVAGAGVSPLSQEPCIHKAVLESELTPEGIEKLDSNH